MQAADFYMAQLNDTPYYFRVDASSRPNVRLADPRKLDQGRGAASLLPATQPASSAGSESEPPSATDAAPSEEVDTGDIIERWDPSSGPQTPPSAPDVHTSHSDLLVGRSVQRARVAAHAQAAAAAGVAPAGAGMDGAQAPAASTRGAPPDPRGARTSTGRVNAAAAPGPSTAAPPADIAFDLSARKRQREAEQQAMLRRSREFMAKRAAEGGGTPSTGGGSGGEAAGGVAGDWRRKAALAADLAGTPDALRGVLPPGMSESDAILKAGSDLLKSLDKWHASVGKQAQQRSSRGMADTKAALPTLPRRRPRFTAASARPPPRSAAAAAGGA